MSDDFGFQGIVPPGASIAENVSIALNHQHSHTPEETAQWFYDTVRNNSPDNFHISQDQSWDYKQLGDIYADFGNFNFGVVGRALGIPDVVLLYGAGWAQGMSNNLTFSQSLVRALTDLENRGDNPGDQEQIMAGIEAARQHDYTSYNSAITDYLERNILDGLLHLTNGLNELGQDITDLFNAAKNWIMPRDPIILDLDGDGLETVGLSSSYVYFDQDGDGILSRTGWAGPDDGLLVWDRDGNGSIDNGAELFGNFTPLRNGLLAPNGFAALEDLDLNGDGVLDASDPAFSELRVWRDADQDGQTDEGELISLADAGIVSLNVTNNLTNQRLSNGNQLSRRGSFTRADGSTGAMGEFQLAINTADSRFTDEIEVPEELQGLPDMGGSGNVRELHQAAALSSELAGLLTGGTRCISLKERRERRRKSGSPQLHKGWPTRRRAYLARDILAVRRIPST